MHYVSHYLNHLEKFHSLPGLRSQDSVQGLTSQIVPYPLLALPVMSQLFPREHVLFQINL